jgi:prepilin-type processing-associated H-X9-DG protein
MKRWGILGRCNISTTFGDIKDGTSNTILTGELQRITEDPTLAVGLTGTTLATALSGDGWAYGSATLFCTAYNGKGKGITTVGLSNNHLFQSPGSEHSGGANYGMGDGSVRWLTTNMDSDVFALLGSMADRISVSPDL